MRRQLSRGQPIAEFRPAVSRLRFLAVLLLAVLVSLAVSGMSFVSLCLLSLVGVWLMFLRLRLRVGTEGIEIRRLLSTRRLGWGSIRSFDVGRFGNVWVTLEDEGQIEIVAVQPPNLDEKLAFLRSSRWRYGP
jgi:hypothetical protein